MRAYSSKFIALFVAASGAAACDKGPAYVRPPASEYTLATFVLSAPPSVDTVQAATISQEFERVIGIRPIIGRLFVADEFRQPQSHTAVISYALWQRRFAGDPTIIGRQIQLDGQNTVVVGVTPANFEYPKGAALWLPRH